MNKVFILASVVLSFVLINLGLSAKTHLEELRSEQAQLESNNLNMKQMVREKEPMPKQAPVPIAVEYGLVMNQIRILESYGGTGMRIQLDGVTDVQDISDHYVDTEYIGIKGLKIKMLIDKFSKETDMGAVLDDIHLLERNSDFMASEITNDNNNLIVKGEIYGL